MKNNNWIQYSSCHLSIDRCKEIMQELKDNGEKCELYSIIYENGKKYAKIKVYN